MLALGVKDRPLYCMWAPCATPATTEPGVTLKHPGMWPQLPGTTNSQIFTVELPFAQHWHAGAPWKVPALILGLQVLISAMYQLLPKLLPLQASHMSWTLRMCWSGVGGRASPLRMTPTVFPVRMQLAGSDDSWSLPWVRHERGCGKPSHSCLQFWVLPVVSVTLSASCVFFPFLKKYPENRLYFGAGQFSLESSFFFFFWNGTV